MLKASRYILSKDTTSELAGLFFTLFF